MKNEYHTAKGGDRLTAYEYQVKARLLKYGKTQNWLAEQVKEHKGGYMDAQYLGKIIKGKVNSPNTVKAINEILGIREAKNDR